MENQKKSDKTSLQNQI